MNGYDIDGVLTAGIRPKKPYVVISGRLLDTIFWTTEQLKRMRIDEPPHLRKDPPEHRWNNERSGLHKATKIKELGVTRFYEDVPEQAEVIKRECPECEVILVKPFKP